MNLEEIGSFKNKVISKLINDDNILDVLLGDVDNIEDPETALLGKDGSGKGGCVFKYEFVPDTQENSKTFLCVEVVPEETNGDTITDMTIYVFAFIYVRDDLSIQKVAPRTLCFDSIPAANEAINQNDATYAGQTVMIRGKDDKYEPWVVQQSAESGRFFVEPFQTQSTNFQWTEF